MLRRSITAPLKHTALAVLLAAGLQAAHAADALTLTISQGGTTQTLSFKSLDDMINTYKNEAELRKAFSWYDPKVDSTAVMNNLGITFKFEIDAGASVGTTKVLMTTYDAKGKVIIPQKTYLGANQDKALATMKEDIKASYSAVQTALASTTPNSLTAGNPNSVQSQLASSQFEQGFTSTASQVIGSPSTTTTTSSGTASNGSTSASNGASSAANGAASSTALRASSLLGLGLRFGQFTQGDVKTQTITLPLAYAWRFDEDERRHVTLGLPLTLGKIDEAKVFNAQINLSVGIPITSQWSLTPAIGYGVAGSLDLAQAAQQVSTSLTSSYVWTFDNGHTLAMGNMVGYYTAVKMKIDEYTSNPDISNTILRNGFMYSVPIELDSTGDTGLTVEFSAINTQYLGTELFVKSSNEFGLTVGTNKRVKGATRYLRAGVSYISAKSSNGFGVNIGYWF